MACPINTEEIAKLKLFIQFASAQPQILNMPQLEFFKKFIEQLGGSVPSGSFQHSRLVRVRILISNNGWCFFFSAEAKAETFTTPPTAPEPAAAPESDPESDVELDLLDTVIQPDSGDAQEMGDENKEATEEEMDQASDLRGKAAKAYSEGDFEGENFSLRKLGNDSKEY